MVALSQNYIHTVGPPYGVKSRIEISRQQVRWSGRACQLTGNDDPNRTVLSSRRTISISWHPIYLAIFYWSQPNESIEYFSQNLRMAVGSVARSV